MVDSDTAAAHGLRLARTVITAQAVTQFGTWFSRIALAFAALGTHSGVVLSAAVIAADSLPRALLGRRIGRLVRTTGARRAAVCGLLAEAVFSLASIAALHSSSVALIAVLIGRSLSSALYGVTFQAGLPQLAGRGADLRRLNFISGLVNSLAVIAGPAVGAAFWASAGITAVLVVDAVTSVLAAGIAWRALGTVAWAAQRNSIVRHGDASRKPLIFANAVAVVGGGLFNVVLPSYATVTLGLTVTESGLVFALFGSGAVLVTLLGSLIARRLDTRVAVLVAFVLSAVSAASLAIPLLPFVGLVVMGAGSALRATSVVGFIQERTPDEHLPATIGALQASTSTGLAIGSLGGTAVAGVVSPHASIIVMAAVTVCALAFYLSSSARARSAE